MTEAGFLIISVVAKPNARPTRSRGAGATLLHAAIPNERSEELGQQKGTLRYD